MATVDKNFRIKNGLVVEGTTGTINGNNILTESAGDSYILNLVGGATLVKSVDTDVFTVDGAGYLTLNSNVVTTTATQTLTNKELVDPLLKGELRLEDSSGTFEALISLSSNELVLDTDSRNIILSPEGGNVYVQNSSTSGNIVVTRDYADNAYDANGAASTALTDANLYTDSAISTLSSTLSSQSSTDISNAITTAENYADSVALSAENAAKSYADGLASNYDANGAAAAAQSAAQSYADGVATTAKNDAKSYADSLASNYDPAGSATSAENAAKSYADGLASNYDAAGAASAAQSAAQMYADGLAGNYDAAGAAGTAYTNALADANTYTDGKVADLVGMAPSLLDTLEKIDNAIANDANFSTTLLTDIATAQATAESYTDSAISTEVTDRNSAIATAKSEAITAAENYADGLASNYDAAGAASAAQSAAQSYADGLAGNYDPAGSASTAQSNAEGYADSLVANGDSNATPTYRALNVGGYTELISGWNSTSAGATFVPVAWNANYGTAKLTVHVRDGVHSQASEVLIARDSNNNIAITEYAIVTTNGTLADISAVYAGGIVSLTVSPTAGHTNVEAVASGSVIVWAD